MILLAQTPRTMASAAAVIPANPSRELAAVAHSQIRLRASTTRAPAIGPAVMNAGAQSANSRNALRVTSSTATANSATTASW